MAINILLLYFLIFIITYLFASIPWGFIIAKSQGMDIRKHGSGNIGATNVRRVLGKKFGITCFVLDFLKGLLPVLLVTILQKKQLIPAESAAPFAIVIAGFATVAGHVWTIYLKFKGGKGIATSAGVILAMAPYSLICAGLTWFIVFKVSRYVSLASILAAVVLPVSAFAFNMLNRTDLGKPVLGLLTILGVLAVVRHISNIKRLLNGTENRFEKKSKYATVDKDKQK